MKLQRPVSEQLPDVLYALGFLRWKRSFVLDFFPGKDIHFIKQIGQAPVGSTVLVWGAGEGTVSDGSDPGRGIIHVEDGFLRSVGLGADVVRPLSWVLDRQGIYYDATRPSDLEHLLQTGHFEEERLSRAEALRQRIVAEGLTKYNVGTGGWSRPATATDQKVILVPGQVESDASIALGATAIRKNIDLLRMVRGLCPDAYVVYKPHPDVVAGLRGKGEKEDGAIRWCDEVVTDCPMDALLDAVDEVHVITSLAGFEALLRDKKVVTYGQPFYAGWGLTEDHGPLPRRTRRLSLDELVAGALIQYPIYISRNRGGYATPEQVLDELLEWKAKGPKNVSLFTRLRRLVLRYLLRVR